jgi:hypothetical protein
LVGGGILTLPRSIFESVNGYDERFVGHAPEDKALYHALRTFAPYQILKYPVQHLYHPRPKDCTDNGIPVGDPRRTLFEQYLAASGDSDAMRALCFAPGHREGVVNVQLSEKVKT